MPDAGGIRAGKAFVELALKDNLTKALDKSARQLKDFGQSITDIGKKTLGVGIAITAPLLVAAQRFAVMGDEINKASQRTGIGVQALTELKYAAENSDVAFEDLEAGVKKMQKTIFEAAVGSDTATKALAALNLTVQDLKDLKPEDQFTLISNRLADIADPAARTAVAMEVMGKGGTKLLTMAGQVDQLRQRARELGITFSKEDAEAATVFGDNLMDVGLQLKAVAFQAGAAVAQALLPFAKTVQHILRDVIDWTKANRGLIFTVLTAGAAVIALGSAILGAGLGIQLMGAALAGIAGGFKLISAALLLVGNPVVLVIAGLAALTAHLLLATKNGGVLLRWLGDRFIDLKRDARTAIDGITDALAAGDVALAAEIMWTALRVEWLRGTTELRQIWAAFLADWLKSGIDGVELFSTAFVSGIGGVSLAWIESVGVMRQVWAGFLIGLQTGWAKAQELITIGAAKIMNNKAEAAAIEAGAKQIAAEQITSALAAGSTEIANADMEREQKTNQAIADLAGQLANIQAQAQALRNVGDAAAEAEILSLAQKKKELEVQLKQLRQQARSEAPRPALVGPGGLSDLDDIAARQREAPKSQGTFNAFAIDALRGAATQDRIARATEETARNTRKLKDFPSSRFS